MKLIRNKLVIGLILTAIVLGIFFKDTLSRKLVYDETTITTGCMVEFCIGDSRTEAIKTVKVILALGNVELWYKNTNIPTHSPDDLNYDKLLNDNLWTLRVRKKLGLRWSYYLYFEGDVTSKIEITKRGPFYFDL